MTRYLLVLFFTLGVVFPTWAQSPSPGRLGIIQNVPNVVQVLDSTNNWSTIGTIDPVTHIFTPDNTVVVSSIVADGFVSATAAMTNGSTTLTGTGRNCITADAGKVVVVAGAGVASAPLKTTVANCSGNNYTLSAPNASGGDISAMVWGIGTDNSAALNAVIAANPNTQISLPCGWIAFDATTVLVDLSHLHGCGVLTNIADLGISASYGTEFLLTNTSVIPFKIRRAANIDGVNFFWPGQTGVTSSPVVYPPLFEDDGTHALADWSLSNVSILNAYDLFTQNPAAISIDQIFWDKVKAYCVHYCFNYSKIGQTFWLSNSSFNPNNFPIARTGNAYLKKWSEQNAEWVHATGNASGATCSTQLSGGMQVSNVGIWVFNKVVNVVNGYFSENSFSGLDVGDVNQLFVADSESLFGGTTVTGGTFQTSGQISAGSPPNVYSVDLEGTCTSGSGNMTFAGVNFVAGHGLFNLAGAAVSTLAVSGSKLQYGLLSGAAAVDDFMDINAVNAKVTVGGNAISSGNTGSFYSGVVVTNTKGLSITGNTFLTAYYALDTSSIATGQINFSGNVMQNTQASVSTNIPTLFNGATYSVLYGANNADKPQAWTVAGLGTCGATNLGEGIFPVTDANVPTWNAILTGLSTTKTNAECNGVNWIAK